VGMGNYSLRQTLKSVFAFALSWLLTGMQKSTELSFIEVGLWEVDQIESGDRHVSRTKRKTPRNI